MSEGYRGYQGGQTQTYRKLYGYKKLIAWQAADDLAAYVHQFVVRLGPRYYRLASQMLDSCSSVKANIAEGYCRNVIGDYVRFCEFARGSLGELGSQIQDCERWGLLEDPELAEMLRRYGDATYLLEQLMRSLWAKRDDGTWNRSMTKEAGIEYLPDRGGIWLQIPDELELSSDSRTSESSQSSQSSQSSYSSQSYQSSHETGLGGAT